MAWEGGVDNVVLRFTCYCFEQFSSRHAFVALQKGTFVCGKSQSKYKFLNGVY